MSQSGRLRMKLGAWSKGLVPRSEVFEPSNLISRFAVHFVHRCSISRWVGPAPSSRLATHHAICVSSAQFFRVRALVLALAILGSINCSGPQTSADQLGLQGRLLANPQDREPRLALARLAQRDGYPARALREYLILERRGQLGERSRDALAGLLYERAKMRLFARDALALSDLLHAKKLGQTIESAQWFEAYSNAAVSQLRHSSRFERARAKAILKKLGDTPLARLRRGHLKLADRSEDELLSLWKWFDESGAKRQALRILIGYVKGGGREEHAVRRWHALHHWWYGESRPALPSEVAESAPIPSVARRFGVQQQATAWASRTNKNEIASWVLAAHLSELEALRSAYQLDPALAGRKGRDFVDASVYGATEMLALAELFYRLGDLPRAQEWTDALAALSPDTPDYAMSACLGNMAIGNVDRAGQWLIRAASASGDPGRYWAIGASSFRRFGHPLAAIAAGRQALDLTAVGEDLLILLELSRAQRAAGRTQDAGETIAELNRRFLAAGITSAPEWQQSDLIPPAAKPTTLLGPLRR